MKSNITKQLKIRVTSGIGTGTTNLSAFDAALFDAGIENFNLILLSSIIPPSCSLTIEKYKQAPMEMGQKLYTVMSRHFGNKENGSVYAGLGWAYTNDGGIFVEHQGRSYNQVRDEIILSMTAMIEHRPFLKSQPLNHKIIGCDRVCSPTCALVAAIYTSEEW